VDPHESNIGEGQTKVTVLGLQLGQANARVFQGPLLVDDWCQSVEAASGIGIAMTIMGTVFDHCEACLGTWRVMMSRHHRGLFYRFYRLAHPH